MKLSMPPFNICYRTSLFFVCCTLVLIQIYHFRINICFLRISFIHILSLFFPSSQRLTRMETGQSHHPTANFCQLGPMTNPTRRKTTQITAVTSGNPFLPSYLSSPRWSSFLCSFSYCQSRFSPHLLQNNSSCFGTTATSENKDYICGFFLQYWEHSFC